MIPVSRAHPIVVPQPLQRLREPFNHRDWYYELKYDGFRALAYIEEGSCRLISRNGNAFGSFRDLAARLPHDVRAKRMVLDGEIVCLDRDGKSQFYDLLYRRAEPCFAAFDVLFVGDEDLRKVPLYKRKVQLKKLLRPKMKRVLYVDHVEERGRDLFNLACERDLEGIVAKWKHGLYTSLREQSSFIKIKNKLYSQIVDRHEHFDERPHEPQPGWERCAAACAAAT